MTLPATGTIRTNKRWCTCPKEMRSGFENVEILVAKVKTECKAKKMVKGAASLICNDKMKINRVANAKASDKIGTMYNFGEDGMDFCRCAHDHRSMRPSGAFELFEDGRGATKTETCLRNPSGTLNKQKMSRLMAKSGQPCEIKNFFHTPIDAGGFTSELLIQHAILDGGPIVASLQAYDDLSNFDGKGVYSISSSAKPSGGHAVVIFGWGVENGIPFWHTKNSWGDHPTKLFRYKRGSNEGDIEKRGASWLYASPKTVAIQRLPLCPSSIMQTDSIDSPRDSCLKLIETGGELGGSVEPSCKVTNICTDGEELPVVGFALKSESSKSECGTSPVFPREINPGQSIEFPGRLRCCISMENKISGKTFKREPGKCMEINSRQSSVLKNTCSYTVRLFKSVDSRRYYTFKPGDEFDIGAKPEDTFFSSRD
jgi:hypothetical protein